MRFNLQFPAWFVLLLTVRLVAQPFPPPVSGGLVDITATVGTETSAVQYDYLPPKSATILAETLYRTLAAKITATATEQPGTAGETTTSFTFDSNYAAGHPNVIRPMGTWELDLNDWFYYSYYQYSKVTKKTTWDAQGQITFSLQAKRLRDGATDTIEGIGAGAAMMAVDAPSFWPTKFNVRDITSVSGDIGRFKWAFNNTTEWRYLLGIQGYFFVTQADGTEVVFHLNHFTGSFGGSRDYYPIGELTVAGTPGQGKGVSYQASVEPLTEAGAYDALKQETWSFTGNFEPTPGASAHYAFSSSTASASKLRYKVVVQPGLARTVTWHETFTPEGASEPSDIRLLSENVTATATETQVHTIDPFARFGAQAGTYQVQAFEAESFEAGLTVDANRDGQILPAAGPMTPYVIANADLISTEKPYGFRINADDDDNDGVADNADLKVNGPDDLADFFPIFLNIKQLLSTLPAGTKCILRQADGALNFVYTDLKQAKAFDYLNNPGTGFGPHFDQPAATATAQQITNEGVELSEEFVNRIRYQNQGVILVEFRAPTQQPLTLTIETGTGVHVMILPLQATLGELAVDANRDGQIKFISEDTSDATSEAQPYRFWLNDDDDNSFQESRWSDRDPEYYPARRADSSNQIIDSPRDCEDLNRIWIDATGLIDALKDTSNELYLGLKWKNTLGTHPSIRLFKGVDNSGGLGHIQNVLIAAEQTTGGSGDTTSAKCCLGDADTSNNTSPSAEQPLIYYPWSGITTVEPPTDVGGIRAADFIFRKDALSQIFGDRSTGYLLFEGVQEGKGELMLVIVRKKSGAWEKVSDGGSVWLQLDNIRRMYVRAHAMPTDADFPLPWQVSSPPSWPYEESAVSSEQKALSIPESRLSYAVGDSLESSSSYPFSPSPGEQANGVIYVHGIDLNVPTQQGYAQSFFKRLWWGGYRGRFIVFRWSTPLSDGIADTPYGWDQEASSIYNSGEYRAFKGGTSLRKFVEGLRKPGTPFYIGANVTIGLAAHSQGNIVAGEALRQGMLVNSYVAMEAAVPLSCYYAPGDQPPTVPRLLQAEAQYLTKFTTSYYQGYFQSIGGAGKKSYHNANDFWLVTGRMSPLFLGLEANWIRNNEAYKPDDPPGTSRYHFDLLEGPAYNRGAGVIRGISDPHELLAYVSRALTLPLGAADDPPQFSDNTDLAADYGFTAQRPDHSGQFQRDIQYMYGNASGVPWRAADGSQQPFYQRLMRDLGIQP